MDTISAFRNWPTSLRIGAASCCAALLVAIGPTDQANALSQVAFTAALSPTTGLTANWISTTDFNLDGKPDLVTSNRDTNNVSVLLGNGDGSFAAKTDYPAGTAPVSVVIADFNLDGFADLATANKDSDNVSVLLGNGDGSFAAKTDYATGDGPAGIIATDVNLDGKPDLIAANFYTDNASVLLNNGNGTFAAKTDYPNGNGPVSISAADINLDGKPDLITADFNPNTVSVLLGNGAGAFAAATPYPTGTSPMQASVADVNLDGKPDLVTANRDTNNASVLLNNGNGTFAAKTDYPVGTAPTAVAIADVNLDGKPDLIVTNSGSNNLSILLGNGTGTFAAKTDHPVGSEPYFTVVVDINLDGRPDLSTANRVSNNVSVLLNSTTPAITGSPSIIGNAQVGQTLTIDTSATSVTAYPTATIGYQWQTSTDGSTGWTNIAGATAAAYTVTTSDYNNYLRATLTATNSVSSATAASPATTQVTNTAPGTPTIQSITAGNGQITVTLTPPTTGGIPTGYTIATFPGGSSCTITNLTNPLICTITGLANDTDYTITAVATNNVGISPSTTPTDPVTPQTNSLNLLLTGIGLQVSLRRKTRLNFSFPDTVGVTGTITVTVNNKPACTIDITGSAGSCNLRFSIPGNQTITAIFTGTGASAGTSATSVTTTTAARVAITNTGTKIRRCTAYGIITGTRTGKGVVTIQRKTSRGWKTTAKTKVKAKATKTGIWKTRTHLANAKTILRARVPGKKANTNKPITIVLTQTRHC